LAGTKTEHRWFPHLQRCNMDIWSVDLLVNRRGLGLCPRILKKNCTGPVWETFSVLQPPASTFWLQKRNPTCVCTGVCVYIERVLVEFIYAIQNRKGFSLTQRSLAIHVQQNWDRVGDQDIMIGTGCGDLS